MNAWLYNTIPACCMTHKMMTVCRQSRIINDNLHLIINIKIKADDWSWGDIFFNTGSLECSLSAILWSWWIIEMQIVKSWLWELRCCHVPAVVTTEVSAVTRFMPAARFLHNEASEPPSVIDTNIQIFISAPPASDRQTDGQTRWLTTTSLWRNSLEWICSNPREASPELYSHHFLHSGIPPAQGGFYGISLKKMGTCCTSEPVVRKWSECLPVNYSSHHINASTAEGSIKTLTSHWSALSFFLKLHLKHLE